MSEAGPDLSVVCKSCGAEVSPYVTECPYCGTRLRKRAPKLERVGDEVRVREGRRERRRRKAAERKARAAERRERLSFAAEYPLATIAAVLIPALLLVIERAAPGLTVFDLGALDGDVGGQVWRFVTASFVFDDVGFIFAYGLALAIFLTGIERRLGPLVAIALVLVTGTAGMLGAELLDRALSDGILVTWGGNGVALGALCCWWVLRESELRADPEEEYERLAVIVAAVVLLLVPVFDDVANAWVGIVGGLVGALAGLIAARLR